MCSLYLLKACLTPHAILIRQYTELRLLPPDCLFSMCLCFCSICNSSQHKEKLPIATQQRNDADFILRRGKARIPAPYELNKGSAPTLRDNHGNAPAADSTLCISPIPQHHYFNQCNISETAMKIMCQVQFSTPVSFLFCFSTSC